MQPQVNPLVQFFPWILIFAIFYFLLIRPQQKKAKEHQEMLNNLKKGDKVLTSGGVYGVVVGIKPSVFEIEIAEEVRIKLAKSAVSQVLKTSSEIETNCKVS
ncbi:preprotein translocase subunit YajC [bacterium]|nr:preprotein translocase subunit YajC [bacterium]